MNIRASALKLKDRARKLLNWGRVRELLDWKKLLDRNRPETLGLDIGSSAIKMVQLHKDSNGYTVTAAAMTNIKDGGGNSAQKDATVATAIRNCRQSAATTPLAVCGLCGPEVAVRPFNFPGLLPNEIEGAVFLEASQVCPFGTDDSTVDWQTAPNGKNEVSGVLVAATNQLIQSKAEMVKDAAFSCVLMDVDGLALLNCLEMCKDSTNGKRTAVLNVGSKYTTLAVTGEKNLPFVRDISYGGQDIIDKIAAEHNISPQTITSALSGDEKSRLAESDVTNSLGRACQKLVAEVADTLRYHSTQEKSAVVEKLLVCGGFALAKGFVQALDSQLSPAVELWNPFDRIRCQAAKNCEDVIRNNGPALAVAAGLAMRSI